MWRTCIRLNSSYKGLLVRYVTPTPTVTRMCERASVKSWMCAHRFCIFQADNLSILSTPIPPQILFSSWRGGGTARAKRKGLRSVVSGREIMNLFKDRKFSFARVWKIRFSHFVERVIRTVTHQKAALRLILLPQECVGILSRYHGYSDNKRNTIARKFCKVRFINYLSNFVS